MNGDETLRTAMARFVSDPGSEHADGPLAGLDPQVLGEALFQFASSAPLQVVDLLGPLFDSFDLFGAGDGADLSLDQVVSVLAQGGSEGALDDGLADSDSSVLDQSDSDESDVDDSGDPAAPDADDDADDDIDDPDTSDDPQDTSGSIFENSLDSSDDGGANHLLFETDRHDLDASDGSGSPWFDDDAEDADPLEPDSVYGDDDDADDLASFDADGGEMFDDG